jgi:hypothetical protein
MFFDDFPKISPCFPLEIPHFSYCQAKEDEIRDWLGPATSRACGSTATRRCPRGGISSENHGKSHTKQKNPWEKPWEEREKPPLEDRLSLDDLCGML